MIGNKAVQPGEYLQPGTRVAALVPGTAVLAREGSEQLTGVDREGIHRDLISEAGRFFSHTLGQSTRAGMQTADQ